MLNRLRTGTGLAISLVWSLAGFTTDAPDYSKEPVVIQNKATEVSFTADRTRKWQQTLSIRMQAKPHTEISAILEKPIAAAPERYDLQALRAEALVRSGQTDQGIAEAQKIVSATSDPRILNDLAYCLADTGSAVDVAQEWAQRALAQTEERTAKASLASFDEKDLGAVILMGAEWDTLGWIYFKQGDMAKAEKYVDASWQLSSRVTVADHLGQIYEEQGRHEAALQIWRLVSATNGNHEDAQERLRTAGVPVSEPLTVLESAKSPPSTSPDEELEKLRTIAVPGVRYRTGGADLFLLLSKDGIEDVQSIDTSADFKDAAHSIRMAAYKFPFPDAGPEKIIRSGILSCSVDRTPSCQVTVLPVLSTPLPAKQLPAKDPASDGGASASYIFPPTLRVKVEPQYSEAAKKARLEGSVLLSIVINEDGIPRNISVVKSLGMGLDENAKECVAKWRFNPATKDGKPVASLANVQVNFVLIEGPQ